MRDEMKIGQAVKTKRQLAALETFVQLAKLLTGRSEVKKAKSGLLTPLLGRFLSK